MSFLDFLSFLFSHDDDDDDDYPHRGFPFPRKNNPVKPDPSQVQFDFFYPNACQVCGRLGQLLRCSRCQMISYCGKQHQTEHWPLHKYFCKLLLDIRKKNGFLRNAKDRRLETWTSAIIASINSLAKKLGRNLTAYEARVIQFNRSCCICHDIEQAGLVNCPNCASVSVCQAHRSRFHQVHTPDKCASFKLCFQLDRDRLRAARDKEARKKSKTAKNRAKKTKSKNDDSDTDSNLDTDSDSDSDSDNESSVIITEIKPAPMSLVPYFEELPETTLKFVQVLSSRPLSLDSVKLKDFEILDLFLKPLSVFRSLQLLGELCKTDVTIHVFGARIDDLETCDFWEILFHLIRGLRRVKIVIVHPEFSWQCLSPKLCAKCMDSERNLLFEKKPFTYADYCADKSYHVPNLIIGFSTSLKLETNVLQMIASRKNVPLALTNNCEKSAQDNHKIVDKLFGKHVHRRLYEKNPFCGVKPSLDFKTDGFYYEHNYLTIYKGFDEPVMTKRKNNGVRK